ncbi:hypothetical protein JL720_10242 [Aureococcus anophagefferens]|nr:hypothetical protein JL720_10242 [Aureococcus anophagefferens]
MGCEMMRWAAALLAAAAASPSTGCFKTDGHGRMTHAVSCEGRSARNGGYACKTQPACAKSCTTGIARNGCWGVARNRTWVALLPEHSGTSTLTDMFTKDLHVDTCSHEHAPPRGRCPDDFLIVLAANPFRRVISSAAWHKKISGGQEIKPWGFDEREQISHFRGWVANLAAPPVRTASELLPRGANPFVLRTNNLQDDTLLLLAALGYPRRNLSSRHCVSSCASTKRTVSAAAFKPSPPWDQRAYYDDATAAKVRRLYARDFDAFGFSRDPQHMFD